MTKRQLNPLRQRFVDEYIVDLNATQAYIRAGYKCTKETARRNASLLLTNNDVKDAIFARQSRMQAKAEVRQEDIIRELRRIAFGDRRSLMSWGPDGVRLRDSDELSDDEAAAVAEISETTSKDGGSIKIKTHDKVRALELLGKHLGTFIERHELTGKDGAPLPAATVTVYIPSNGRGG
jgi:phage terminase small subunit